MTLHKGTLHYYFATGETPHFYVWTGPEGYHDFSAHHVMIETGDLVELSGDHWLMPDGLEALEKLLKKKKYKVFCAAVRSETHPVEVLKFG